MAKKELVGYWVTKALGERIVYFWKGRPVVNAFGIAESGLTGARRIMGMHESVFNELFSLHVPDGKPVHVTKVKAVLEVKEES